MTFYDRYTELEVAQLRHEIASIWERIHKVIDESMIKDFKTGGIINYINNKDMKIGDKVILKADADLKRSHLKWSDFDNTGRCGVVDDINRNPDHNDGQMYVAFGENKELWWIHEDMLVVYHSEHPEASISVRHKLDEGLLGMTREEYLEFHKKFTDEMIEVTQAKNNDYSGHSESPFANFELVEKMGFISTEEGFVTRMTDKVSRVMTFIKKGVLLVKGEGVRDALMDLANYCILLAGYIEHKRMIEENKSVTNK